VDVIWIITSYKKPSFIQNLPTLLQQQTLAFSKHIDCYRAATVWEDAYYNLIRPHKSLAQRVSNGRQKWRKQTPAMAAELTDHIWTV